MKCANCGEEIELFKPFGLEPAPDHPYRAEFVAFGGWWVHAAGPKRYLRSCAFGATLAESYQGYQRFGAAQATPAPVEV